MAKYKGPRWPFERHLVPRPDFNRDPGVLVDLFLAWDRSQSVLRSEFDAPAAAVDSNPDLRAAKVVRLKTGTRD